MNRTGRIFRRIKRFFVLDEDYIVGLLESGDFYKISDAFSKLFNKREYIPSEKIIQAVKKQLSNLDEYIRHESVFLLGVRWSVSSVMNTFIELLSIEKSDYVLRVVLSSIGSIAKTDSKLHNKAEKIFYDTYENKRYHNDIRGVAYKEILFLNNLISAKNRVMLSDDINIIEVDTELINELKNRYCDDME